MTEQYKPLTQDEIAVLRSHVAMWGGGRLAADITGCGECPMAAYRGDPENWNCADTDEHRSTVNC